MGWYNTTRWRKIRSMVLSDGPLCVKCGHLGQVTPATDVDHIKPHKGDYLMFFDTSNLQPLCRECHSRKTAAEDGGFGNQCGKPRADCGVDGMPTDRRHHWRR